MVNKIIAVIPARGGSTRIPHKNIIDFMGKPFGPMPALMAVAEDIQKVHAICVKCGSPANHSHRLSSSDKLVVLGEKDIYEPLCRHCYNAAIQAEKDAQN